MQVRYATGPQLVSSDANTEFGEATIGFGSHMIAVPVRNEGGGIARNLEPVVEGDDDFQVDMDTCRDAVLAVGAQCWIRVYFRPETLGGREADIGLVAEDSRLVWTVAFSGTGQPAPPPQQQAPPAQPVITILSPPIRPGTIRPTTTTKSVPVADVRPGAPTITRPTLAVLLRSGLRFTQRFRTAGRVTWTLEYHGTVLARAHHTVTVGRTSVTLKLTATGKRVLRRHKPATLTLRTRGTLERVSTVRLHRR